MRRSLLLIAALALLAALGTASHASSRPAVLTGCTADKCSTIGFCSIECNRCSDRTCVLEFDEE